VDPTAWAEFGAVGLLAGVCLLLFMRERKESSKYTKKFWEHQAADAAAKNKLANTLENLADTVEALGTNSKSDIAGCRRICTDMIGHVREQMARESGRREVTDRIHLGDGHEK